MLYGLLNIGQSALNASQAWISVTGNNLANADTEGYSRQYVDQRDAGGLTAKPGAQGLGVNAQQIMRFFDSFLERSYVRQATNSARWDEQDTIMTSLENIFNESNRAGLSSSLNKFFTAWQDLALRPEDTATRESLLSYADNLSDMFGSTMDGIKAIQKEMDVSIGQTVDRVNDISKAIADLNRQITSNTVDGVSNPNSLLDKRDQLVRELASLADVETIDNGKGNFRVQLSNGQPLVDGQNSYELKIMGPQSENRLTVNSPYKGSVQFDGADSHEYTVEIVNGGNAGDVPPPQFRVSLDGGKTWLRDDDGKELHYDITDSDGDGTYSDEEKQKAKAAIDDVYARWEQSDQTEDDFAQLANSFSQDSGSNTKGGLYENVYKGQMVQEFNDFCFDPARKPGDVGIVFNESDSYCGYHLVYYVGQGERYCDYLGDQALRTDDFNAWEDTFFDGWTSTELKGMKYVG